MADEQQPEQQQQPQRRWNNRPESTIAQNFAADLDSMFGLGAAAEGVENLSKTVEEKKANVTSREQTLQELEAKLRETEERLAKVSRHNSPSREQQQANTAVPRTHPDTTKQGADAGPRSSPLGAQPMYPADRPPTSNERPAAERQDTDAMMSNMPGAMPETPQQQYTGNNEYVMVDRNLSAGQAQRGYG